MGQRGRADLSLRARQHHRALRAAAAAPAGRLDDGRDELGRAALHGAAAPGAAGPALRLRPVVSQGGGVRPLRLGGASAVSRAASSTASSRRFTVDLDVPEDQVMGATGVPVCGDPGWERANRAADRPVEYQRDYYGAEHAVGRRVRRRRAGPEADPLVRRSTCTTSRCRSTRTYRYEGGHFGDVAVHVLYQPGDEKTWGGGVAVERTADGARLAGPAVRAVRLAADHQRAPDRGRRHRVPDDDPRRLGRSGADRPRARAQLHDGHPGQQRVARRLARRGIHQLPDELVLGDDGPAERYARDRGRGAASSISTTTPSRPASWRRTYRDFTSYNIAIYTRGELFFHQLRAHRGRRRRCTGSCRRSTSAGSTSTWTRRRSARSPRRCPTATSRPSSPSGCTRPSCTTTRSGRGPDGTRGERTAG